MVTIQCVIDQLINSTFFDTQKVIIIISNIDVTAVGDYSHNHHISLLTQTVDINSFVDTITNRMKHRLHD
jgi:hypothetical protein